MTLIQIFKELDTAAPINVIQMEKSKIITFVVVEEN